LPTSRPGARRRRAGDPQGGRRVPAARSRLPGAPPGADARGLAGGRRRGDVIARPRAAPPRGPRRLPPPPGTPPRRPRRPRAGPPGAGHAPPAPGPAAPPPSDARPEPLAYVIYTSGSTGAPRGVMVEPRQASSFFAAMDRVLDARAEPGVWLAATSLSFDISVL